MMQFLLDDLLFDDPIDWRELETTIKRDFVYNSVLANQDLDINFTGDAYDYLYTKLNTEGFCSKVKFVVQSSTDGITYSTLLRGNLFLSDCVFNERTCNVSCNIEDNSFFAMINNNKSLKTVINAGQSKNGVAITVAPVYVVDFLNIYTLGLSRTVNCYRVYDAFEYLIKFMSDGKLQFKSDYLQTTSFTDFYEGYITGKGWKGLAITTGWNIRNGNTIPDDYSQSEFSFDDLFKEIDRRIPLVLTVENPYSENPTVRIENRNFQYTNQTTFNASNVYEVISKVDTKSLYAGVNVGTSITSDIGPYPERIHFFGYNDEQYIVQAECNIDTILDLRCDWVTSSNVITDTLNGNQSYDGNLFLVETDYSLGDTWNLNQLGMITAPVPFFFNSNLTNNYILNRYRNGIPGNLRSFTGVTGDGLMNSTELTAQPIGLLTTLTATTVIANVGGYWNAVDRYTAPLSGVYTFNLTGTATSTGYTGAFGESCTIGIYAFIYDAANVLQSNNQFGGLITMNQVQPNQSYNSTESLILNDNWYVIFKAQESSSPIAVTATILAGSTIQCVDNTIGGGLFVESNDFDFPIYTYEFKYPMCQEEFDTIMANTVGTIQFNMEGQSFRQGWIQELSFNHFEGMANIKLISKNNGN